MANKQDLNILGKDYLTQDEAAHYACCSIRKFQDWAKESGITPTRPHGRLVYRRKDIQRILEAEWQQYEKTG